MSMPSSLLCSLCWHAVRHLASLVTHLHPCQEQRTQPALLHVHSLLAWVLTHLPEVLTQLLEVLPQLLGLMATHAVLTQEALTQLLTRARRRY